MGERNRGKDMKRQRARYARFTNRFVVLLCLCALVYFARGAVIMLAGPAMVVAGRPCGRDRARLCL